MRDSIRRRAQTIGRAVFDLLTALKLHHQPARIFRVRASFIESTTASVAGTVDAPIMQPPSAPRKLVDPRRGEPSPGALVACLLAERALLVEG